MIQTTVLPNQLRVMTKTLPSTNAVTVLIFVGSGSRYESKANNGIAHFLEHMFFKGGLRYKNTKEVSGAIDAIGGDFNAFTGKEYVGYYVKASKDNLDVIVDVLSDMMMNAQFDSAEIDKERGVIMEELNMYQDTPMYQVGWDFEKLLYGDQPLGWDQIGTKELIRSVTRDDFKKYQEDLYTPENMVVVVTGNVEHSEMVKKISEAFPIPSGTKKYDCLSVVEFVPESPVHMVVKKTEQAHIVCGFEGYHHDHPLRNAKKLLAIALGGNMSSRMFLNVREDKGLAYYISTSTDYFMDTGVISTRAGVDTARVPLAVEAIVREYKTVAKEGITEEELQKAKNYIKGKVVLRLEDTEEYAYFIAEQALLESKVKSVEEMFAEIDAVTLEEVNQVARELFVPEKIRLAIIGPELDKVGLEEALKMR